MLMPYSCIHIGIVELYISQDELNETTLVLGFGVTRG